MSAESEVMPESPRSVDGKEVDELELTAEVLELVQKFKESEDFKNVMIECADQMYARQINEDRDDTIIIKCIKEKKNNVKQAVELFVKLMNWRKERNIDRALDDWNFDVEGIKASYPHSFQGFDSYGRPIYVERLGKIDTKKLSKVVTMEQFADYHILHHEYLQRVLLPKASEMSGHPVKQFITICDLDGIGLSQLSKSVLDLLGKIAEIDQNYYPASGHRLYLVNVPWLFKAVWKMISPFIAARGRDKIKIIYGSLEGKLGSSIDLARLPTYLGGKVDAETEQTEDEIAYKKLITGQTTLRETLKIE
eukprot:TRINITY_DN781_c0_g1_i1.p1 TRINITY_DN781_c0_g1~~TRINITY_DN781_c0_g1_i1.p1  ORF type:complete len:328 (+),score=94.46 TRINITY_DN781_c0_g1_i1:63-986(+)